MLIVIMVGLAMGVVLATQQDLSVAGQDREQAQSLYAAEYAVAMAKAYLANTTGLWAPSPSGWSPLLSGNTDPHLCGPRPLFPNSPTPVTTPDSTLNPPQPMPTWQPPSGMTSNPVKWQYCIHNNADDPSYLDPAPVGSPPLGDNTDSRDKLNLIVIEAYGTSYNGAQTHLAVTVGTPVNTPTNPNDCRGVEAGTAGHLGHCN
jgi:type II secretory pathway pseudopilin PulG